MDEGQKFSIGFGNRKENHVDVEVEGEIFWDGFDVIYILTNEMISIIEHFAILYEEYHIDFEEMYYDLTKMLNRPLSKGVNMDNQNEVLKNFEEIMKG